MRKAKLPLNPDAVKAADKALYDKHPELGGRKLTMGPEDGALRKEWMDSYLANGGEAADPPAPQPPGSITTPCPKPDPGQEVYSKNLVIKGDKAFRDKVRKDLDDLKATKTRKSILDAIADGRHPVTIEELSKKEAQESGGLCTPDDDAASRDPKKGTPSTVSYSPDHSGDEYTDQNGDPVEHPAKAYLGHELIHAVHASQGTDESNKPDPKEPGSNQEESKTIGINDHADEPMSENNLLKELGYDYKRTNHDMTAESEPKPAPADGGGT